MKLYNASAGSRCLGEVFGDDANDALDTARMLMADDPDAPRPTRVTRGSWRATSQQQTSKKRGKP